MRLVSALIIAVLFCSTASAIELSLVGNDEDPSLTIGLSETGTISIRMVLFEGDGDVASAQFWFDQFGVDSFDVEDAIVEPPWQANRDGMDFPLESLEDFIGAYFVEGLEGPWEGHIDNIIVHGMAVGETDVYFEGLGAGGGRPPAIFDSNNNQHGYAQNLQIPGFIWFTNAWRDESIGFDEPFPVTVIPEPATAAMFLIGGAALLARRRNNRSALGDAGRV